MRVDPDGAELLRVARAELLEKLLPQLPASHHYAARMVANAMAIASREMAAPVALELDARGLSHEIRSGRHDNSDAIHERLLALTRERLAVSNPRVLEGSR